MDAFEKLPINSANMPAETLAVVINRSWLNIPLSYALVLALVLFVFGLLVVLLRQTWFMKVVGIQVMFLASVIVILASGLYWQDASAQAMVLVILICALVQVFVALGISYASHQGGLSTQWLPITATQNTDSKDNISKDDIEEELEDSAK